jgi:hypothetical protein
MDPCGASTRLRLNLSPPPIKYTLGSIKQDTERGTSFEGLAITRYVDLIITVKAKDEQMVKG